MKWLRSSKHSPRQVCVMNHAGHWPAWFNTKSLNKTGGVERWSSYCHVFVSSHSTSEIREFACNTVTWPTFFGRGLGGLKHPPITGQTPHPLHWANLQWVELKCSNTARINLCAYIILFIQRLRLATSNIQKISTYIFVENGGFQQRILLTVEVLEKVYHLHPRCYLVRREAADCKCRQPTTLFVL